MFAASLSGNILQIEYLSSDKAVTRDEKKSLRQKKIKHLNPNGELDRFNSSPKIKKRLNSPVHGRNY